MKRFFTSVAFLVLIVVFATGCGVSQDGYDAAIKEASNLQGQLSSVQASLTTAQADLSKSKADLTTAQANLTKSTADLTTAQQSFSTLNTSVKTYQAYVDATNLWFDMMLNWASWNQQTWDTWNVKLDTAVANSKDSTLQTLNQTMETKTGDEHNVAEKAFANLLVQRLNELKPKTN